MPEISKCQAIASQKFQKLKLACVKSSTVYRNNLYVPLYPRIYIDLWSNEIFTIFNIWFRIKRNYLTETQAQLNSYILFYIRYMYRNHNRAQLTKKVTSVNR